MANEALWGEMLDVLKDIGEYLSKAGDADQKPAAIDKPPKIGENQANKPIKGGEAPGFGPGKNALIAKEFPPMGSAEGNPETSEISSEEGTMLKAEDLGEMREEGEDEYRDDIPSRESSSSSSSRSSEDALEGEDPELELRSLLKDIRNALVMKATSESKSKESSKSTPTKTSESVSKSLVDGVVTEIKKALPSMINAESHRMLRKMGFSPSRPDIVKFGLDEDIKKSGDSIEDKSKEVYKVVEDLSKKSWQELGQIREKTGDFNVFGR